MIANNTQLPVESSPTAAAQPMTGGKAPGTAPTNVLRVENSQTLLMTFYATGTEDYYIDERAIRYAVAGQTLAQAQATVAQQWPLMESPQMWVEPSWYGRMPLFDFRIQVVVER